MKKVAILGLEKNNVWDFFNNIQFLKDKHHVELIPFIYSKNDKKYSFQISLELLTFPIFQRKTGRHHSQLYFEKNDLNIQFFRHLK